MSGDKGRVRCERLRRQYFGVTVIIFMYFWEEMIPFVKVTACGLNMVF